VLANWDVLKAQEKAAQGDAAKKSRKAGALGGVPLGLPALLRAHRIGEKAAKVGFDWPDAEGVIDKVREELVEIEDAMKGGDPAEITHEVGDLLLAASRLSAKLGVASEDALREATARFERRFGAVEAELARQGKTPAESDLEEMDRLWTQAKRDEAERALAARKLDAGAHKK
jgi:uncharacterized protein YabN with tetrapyrrole methylase and pyrophosphatase domain